MTDQNITVEAPVSLQETPQAPVPTHVDRFALLVEAVRGGQLDGSTAQALAQTAQFMRDADASAAWSEAFADAQAELPAVFNASEGHQGNYAKFHAVVSVARPICARHGLSFTFTTEGRGDDMQMVCLLRHRQGHVEASRFPCYIDPKMAANASQKVASASSYAKRYALLLALGMATTDERDDDAQSLTDTITPEQAADLESLCSEVGADRDRFLKWLQAESFEALPTAKHAQAVKGLEAKRRKG